MSHPTDPDVSDDMLPEYDFSKGVRGKHHQAYRAGTNVVFLDPDIAAAFPTSAAVNEALRAVLRGKTVARRATAARKRAKATGRGK